MRRNLPIRPATRPAEQGYILVGVMFMLAVLIIAMSVAAPKIAKSIQRDRELETMHRGKQYSRAVKLYYKQFNAYPPNLDALVKTNEIRFLRKKYIDPTTGKDEWKPIRFGQQKTQTMGFFGQPLALGATGMMGTPGLNGAGAGLNGAAGATGLNGASPSGAFGSSGGFGSSGIGTSAFGSSSTNSTTPGTGSSIVGGGVTSTGSPTDSSATTDTGSGQTNTSTNGTSNIGSTTQSAFGTPNGQTFGGAGIIGFSPNSPKQSILVYKKKNHYNEWEFFYDPVSDQMTMQGGNAGSVGTAATNMNGSSAIGSGSSFGSGTGTGSGFGSGSDFGSSSTSGTTTTSPSTPAQPQQ